MHPNDHVNASQSSNDVFPTTIHLAATEALATDVIPALEHLAATLRRRAADWADVVKAGRTHLMDAVPITLGQEAGGWATQVEYGAARVRDVLPRLGQLPIGGTAVGTGLNAPDGFGAAVVDELRAATGLDALSEAEDHIEAQGARDGLVEASGALRTVAVSLYKIANDIRWLGSGPRTGLAELHLPDLQPGSSIMPGKVNPVICEATMMVAAQVIGNDALRGVLRQPGQPAAQRDDAGDGPQPAGVGPAAGQRGPAAGRQGRRRRRGRRRADPRVRRVLAVDGHAAEPVHRLRGGGRRSPSRRSRSARRSARWCWSAATSRTGSSPSSSSTPRSTCWPWPAAAAG